jgi:tRNA(adenine34) deaminase
MDYDFFMNEAYEQALIAMDNNEIPIGCVIVFENKIIAKGFNQRNKNKNSLHHAEIIAINKACEYIKDWRLEECTLFVTVEPCPMCAGAILQARIKTLVFATHNKKAGCCGSILNLLDNDKFNHKVDIITGIMQQQCSNLMSDFFKTIRLK